MDDQLHLKLSEKIVPKLKYLSIATYYEFTNHYEYTNQLAYSYISKN